MMDKLHYLLVFALIFSCQPTKTSENLNLITNEVKGIIERDQFLNIDSVIIIPNEGCGGCISHATNYLLTNREFLKNVAIIFTGIDDKKIFKKITPLEFLEMKEVFIDEVDALMKPAIRSVYPRVIYLEKGQAVDIQIFSPQF